MSSDFDMDTKSQSSIGQRLRYFREKEVGESREKFIQGLGITSRTLERYESDGSVPDGAFLTRLNSKYRETINLDWLLTGRGSVYLAPEPGPESAASAAREDESDYYDLVLEKMHRQLDRIYREKDFLKLAAIQSLLNLTDPEEKK
jgi:transcriptional regulator with XRE-family HTH domain